MLTQYSSVDDWLNGCAGLCFLPGVVCGSISPRTGASSDGAVTATISSFCAMTPPVKSD